MYDSILCQEVQAQCRAKNIKKLAIHTPVKHYRKNTDAI